MSRWDPTERELAEEFTRRQLEEGEELIARLRERAARNARERSAGPLVERLCGTCGEDLRAPASARHAHCHSTGCAGQLRALVPMDGEARAEALEALASEADLDAARWLTYDPSQPQVMRDLAARARARADHWRRMAAEARGEVLAAEE